MSAISRSVWGLASPSILGTEVLAMPILAQGAMRWEANFEQYSRKWETVSGDLHRRQSAESVARIAGKFEGHMPCK